MSRATLFLSLLGGCLPEGVTAGGPSSRADPWAGVDAVLQTAIAQRVFPGCVAVVRNASGDVLYSRAHGRLTYAPSSAAITTNTLFDMASLSKIIGPTTAAAVLTQLGELDLDAPVAGDLGVGFCAGDARKCSITPRHLLTHTAGFPPDPTPLGWSDAAFGCPATTPSGPPPAEDFSCAPLVWASLCAQPLVTAPGAAFVYSDLSAITLLLALGSRVLSRHPEWVSPADMGAACRAAWGTGPPPAAVVRATCAFEALWRSRVADPLGLSASTGWRPTTPAAAAPTWFDAVYRREQLQGVVSDENAYAAGGIAGHAGIFASGDDASAFLSAWALGSRKRPPLLSDATIAEWTRVADPRISPRALGWSTNGDSYAGCGPLWSNATAYHTGYTGTQLCVEPRVGATVLLAARVYPNKTANVAEIHSVRVAFNSAAALALKQLNA